MSTDSSSNESLSVYGRVPLLLKEREYGTISANGTCFAYAIATWCFLTGGYAAQLVGAVQGFSDMVKCQLVIGCNKNVGITIWITYGVEAWWYGKTVATESEAHACGTSPVGKREYCLGSGYTAVVAFDRSVCPREVAESYARFGTAFGDHFLSLALRRTCLSLMVRLFMPCELILSRMLSISC